MAFPLVKELFFSADKTLNKTTPPSGCNRLGGLFMFLFKVDVSEIYFLSRMAKAFLPTPYFSFLFLVRAQ